MGEIRLARPAVRIVSLVMITVLFATVVSAYTVVMRDGRRIEIPSRFEVSQHTLTYEVSSGVQITLALAAIDIAATEKVNNESPGSLLKRGERAPADTPSRSTRTITNRELEPSMRRRRESEAAYEIRRKKLGLPTLEEARKSAAAIPDVTGTELEQKLIADRDSEAYWRGRASALRTEMEALDAELGYVRYRFEEASALTPAASSWSTATIFPLISFGMVGRGHASPQRVMHLPNIFSAPRGSSQLTGRVGFGGGATRGQVLLNPGGFQHQRSFGRGRVGSAPGWANAGNVVFVGQPGDYWSERNALITRFTELAGARAGLSARWREFEDEARRAGASPGWLRR